MAEKVLFRAVDAPDVHWHDVLRALEIAEEMFHTQTDADQMLLNAGYARWVVSVIPCCWTLIVLGGTVVGGQFVLPTSIDMMRSFLGGNLSERAMMDEVRENGARDWDALYLAGATVVPDHRRKGLALEALSRTVEGIAKRRAARLELFYWPFSTEGRSLVTRFVARTGWNVHERNTSG
ncbi:MAG TPA: hypothetical protein VK727_09605 [Steroidobacteraceae bacterium]|nr:hypothetical protein [Steroidobacteraceae bacterium]